MTCVVMTVMPGRDHENKKRLANNRHFGARISKTNVCRGSVYKVKGQIMELLVENLIFCAIYVVNIVIRCRSLL